MATREKSKERLARLQNATRNGTFPTADKADLLPPKGKSATSRNDAAQVSNRQQAENELGDEVGFSRGGKKPSSRKAK